MLEHLIAETEAGLTDLAIAQARVDEARAIVDWERAERQPDLWLALGARREHLPESRSPLEDGTWTRTPAHARNRFDLGVEGRWEADLSGRRELAVDAAGAALAAARHDHASVRRAAILETVHAWSEAREAEALRAITQQAAAHADTLVLAERRRLAAGLVDRAKLRAAELQRDRLHQLRTGIDQRHAQALARLAALQGRRGELVWQAMPDYLPPVPGTSQQEAGTPELLDARPDVHAAWQRLLAATRAEEHARLERHPRLTLTTGGGLASETLRRWLRGDALVWMLGAALQAPLFDGGRVQARLDAAAARRAAYEAAYRQTLVAAWQEAAEAAANLRATREQLALAQAASARTQVATEETARRARTGLADRIDVARAELERLDTAHELATARHRTLRDWATLQQAFAR